MNASTGFADVEAEARRAQRKTMLLAIHLYLRDGQQLDARVKNISASGLQAVCSHSFTIGEAVDVTLRGLGVVEAEVRWATRDRVGLHFLQPIEVAKLGQVGHEGIIPKEKPIAELLVHKGDFRRPGLRAR